MKKVLIIIERKEFVKLVFDFFDYFAFKVEIIGTSPRFLEAVQRKSPDLFILCPNQEPGRWLRTIPILQKHGAIKIMCLLGSGKSRLHERLAHQADVFLTDQDNLIDIHRAFLKLRKSKGKRRKSFRI